MRREDDKVVAIHVDDPESAHYQDLGDLPSHLVRELEQFFLDYKELEGKTVAVEGLRGRARAEQVIETAARAYGETFGTEGRRLTMKIDLSAADVEVLRESMEIYLADFRREVAGTENPEMRHRLQRKQNALESILTVAVEDHLVDFADFRRRHPRGRVWRRHDHGLDRGACPVRSTGARHRDTVVVGNRSLTTSRAARRAVRAAGVSRAPAGSVLACRSQAHRRPITHANRS